MFRLDLHTHSTASKDGGISASQYAKALNAGILDKIAVTDHDRIDFALHLRERLGKRIIVGEEVLAKEGEIIGLYLTKPVKPGQSAHDTIMQIKAQGGIVYIPHPFESVRKGLHPKTMEELTEYIDIVEVCNGRAFFQNRSEQTAVWAKLNNKVGAASSDAHGIGGLGRTYTALKNEPTKKTLVDLVAHGVTITGRPSAKSLLYPKFNRLRKKIGMGK